MAAFLKFCETQHLNTFLLNFAKFREFPTNILFDHKQILLFGNMRDEWGLRGTRDEGLGIRGNGLEVRIKGYWVRDQV